MEVIVLTYYLEVTSIIQLEEAMDSFTPFHEIDIDTSYRAASRFQGVTASV